MFYFIWERVQTQYHSSTYRRPDKAMSYVRGVLVSLSSSAYAKIPPLALFDFDFLDELLDLFFFFFLSELDLNFLFIIA